jgi:hypothetical protein
VVCEAVPPVGTTSMYGGVPEAGYVPARTVTSSIGMTIKRASANAINCFVFRVLIFMFYFSFLCYFFQSGGLWW